VQIVMLNKTNIYADAEVAQYTFASEDCVVENVLRQCMLAIPISLPSNATSTYLISVQAVSLESAGEQGVMVSFLSVIAATEPFDVIGAPSAVGPISLVAIRPDSFSIRWRQPEYFFPNLDAKTNSYQLFLTCTDLSLSEGKLEVLYTMQNSEVLGKPTSVADFQLRWSEDFAEVEITAFGGKMQSNASALCQQGASVQVSIRASNRLFDGPLSTPLDFNAISVPSSPVLTAFETATGFELTWSKVKICPV